MGRLRFLGAALLTALFAVSSQGAEFDLLGFISNANPPLSVATGLSRDGSKICGYVNNSNSVLQGCFWDSQGLHLLADTTKAVAVADSGELVVGSFNDEGFYWTGTTKDVGSGNDIFFSNVSANGEFVVGFDRELGNGALYFPVPGTARMLASLVPGNMEGANSISLDGSVVVGYSQFQNLTGKPSVAAYWDPGGAHRLPTYTGYDSASAVSINDGGTVALVIETDTKGKLIPAVSIAADGGLLYSQPVPITNVTAISDDGNCFAGTWNHGTSTSFIWTRGGGFVDATTFLTNHGVNVGSNTIAAITGVTANGNKFCGICTNTNAPNGEGFVAIIDPIYPALKSFTLSAGTVVGGNAISGTVSLEQTAPQSLYVSVAPNTGGVIHSLPLFASGSQTKTFPVYTSGVSTQTTFVVQAYLGGHFINQDLVLEPASMVSLTVPTGKVPGGFPTVGHINLNGLSPLTGASVTLTSSNTSAATVPATATLAGNESSPAFDIATMPVSGTQQTTISATYGAVTKSAVLTVIPATFSYFHFNPASILGGSSVTGYASMDGLSTLNTTVTLSSGNASVVKVPASVEIPAGKAFASFSATTVATYADTAVTVTGTAGSITIKAVLTVKGVAPLDVLATPSNVKGGNKLTILVQMDENTPPNGVSVTLTSNDPLVLQVPSSVLVPGGKSQVSVTATTKTVTSNTSVTVTASYHSSVTCKVTVVP